MTKVSTLVWKVRTVLGCLLLYGKSYMPQSVRIKNNTINTQVTLFKPDETKNPNDIYFEKGHLSITNREYDKLSSKYDPVIVDDFIYKVTNYNKNKKYKSLYLTVNRWIERHNEGIILARDVNEEIKLSLRAMGSFLKALLELYPDIDVDGVISCTEYIDDGYKDELVKLNILNNT